jgi:hypothetical protein
MNPAPLTDSPPSTDTAPLAATPPLARSAQATNTASLRPLREIYKTAACHEYVLGKISADTIRRLPHGHTLVPEGFGGFGNQFASFIRGLFVCYILGYERLGLYQLGFCFQGNFKTTDGIEVLTSSPNGGGPGALTVNSFEVDGCPSCPLDDVRIAATIRDELVKCLPEVTVNDSALYICARGGELFETGTPFWWHGQPPCQYYLDAMRMDHAPVTYVMSNQDKPSPCVAPLVNSGAKFASKEVPMEDLARFIHSKRIVVSRTSFTTAIMLLSKPKDALYAFVTQYSMCIWPNHTFLNDYYDRFGKHHKCKATPYYDEMVLKEWHALDHQIAIMKNTTGCTWSYE